MVVSTIELRSVELLLRCEGNDGAADIVLAHADEIDALRARLSMAREFAVGRLHVVWRSEGAWAVADGPFVLNRDGQWEWEPLPSGREEDFLARTRYTLVEALDAARALVEREAKECKACSGSGVVDDGSHGGIADTTPCDECGGTGVTEYPVEKCECGGRA